MHLYHDFSGRHRIVVHRRIKIGETPGGENSHLGFVEGVTHPNFEGTLNDANVFPFGMPMRCDASTIPLGSFPDIPGRSHRKDALIAAGEKHPFQKPAALIVEEIFVPFVFHEFGYDDNNAAIGMLF
jgi:hypothetical protein